MVGSVNANVASYLLGLAASGETPGVSASLLAAAAKAKNPAAVDPDTIGVDPKAPLASVFQPGISPSAESLVARALASKSFFDTEAKLFSDLGAVGDYKRLFALYTGLSTLQALADRARDDKLPSFELARTQTQFARGLAELETFFAQQKFDDITLAQGDRVDAAQTGLALPSRSEDYVTGVIHAGSLSSVVSGLDPNARFDIVATSSTGTVRRVAIDLSELGTQPRSLGAVVSFVNSKLSAASAASRLETEDRTPKESTQVVGGRVVKSRFTGARQYALKLDIRAGESVAFEPVGAAPAFYAVGEANGAPRLVKLADVSGAVGQPVTRARPGATADPIGAHVATGFLGPGAPYASPPANVYEQRSNLLVSAGENNFETALRDAGEAVLKLRFEDGRTLSVTTGWRSGDLEAWRTRTGESSDRALIDDLAERLTQLLHEQGVAAGVDVYETADGLGLSVFSGDLVRASSLSISGRAVTFETIDPPGMVVGLRDGVYARRYQAGAVAAASDLFIGAQSFVITTVSGAETISIDGGSDGVDAATIIERLNTELRKRGLSAAASFFDNGGALDLRIDGLHSLIGVSATINAATHTAVLQAPGAWADGGLPAAAAGQPFADALRGYAVAGGSPLLTHTGALDIVLTVATPTGEKTVSVSVSADERAADPDPAPGQWSAAFQARLDAALNAAGVYVRADGDDLAHFTAAEGAGHRITGLSINGAAATLASDAPTLGLGGAFTVERSFTSAQAATGVSDESAALTADQSVSITFDTVWGARTVSATLAPSDPRTLESAALRLNEALVSAGYDLGVEATALSGGGAGLRIVAGASHSIRAAQQIALGAQTYAVTLDPIDSASRADDPAGALRVAARAARDAAVSETIPSASAFTAPSVNASGFFPGRAFDVAVAGGEKSAAARAVATGADGSVYVLADLSADSAAGQVKGKSDVALFKYDSAGKLLFSRSLGAAQTAAGFALAVSADGKVAVAGSVEGALAGANAPKGGADSFVTLFDAHGEELWTQRRGATANDEARAIAFAADGSIIVTGKTESALGGAAALGGADGYVRGYSSAGAELFTRQFGTAGADAATALVVRDDGAGGLEIFTGGVENDRGVIRRFTYSGVAGFAAGAVRDIGFFYKGAINALAADGASLYVGGEIGADRLTLGTPARGAAAGQEGFVARLDADLASTALDRATYLGSAQDDSVKSLHLVNGTLYAAGLSGGVIAGEGKAKSRAAFLSRLDASGEPIAMRTFNSSAGSLSLAGVAVDAGGASPLDVLGLPRGIATPFDPAPLVDRSALRVGDEFNIGEDGRRLTTIRIGATDSLAELAGAINRSLNGAGRAEIVRENGAERLKITARDGRALRIEAGRADHDALAGLGLNPGVVAVSQVGRGGLKAFGLGLIAEKLKIDTPEKATSAKARLSGAVSIVRQAYEALLRPNAKPLTPEEQALADKRAKAGAAPQYLLDQLANYQAALARLGG